METPVEQIGQSIAVFTDGACSGNGKAISKGGVGVYFPDSQLEDISEILDDSVHKATNYRAELQAIISAVTAWQSSQFRDSILIIYSDSYYGVKICTEWMYGWVGKGIQKMNWDLVMRLYELIAPQRERIKFVHVRGHQKAKDTDSEYTKYVIAGNTKADVLATSALSGRSDAYKRSE